jgi:hypothetical protein
LSGDVAAHNLRSVSGTDPSEAPLAVTSFLALGTIGARIPFVEKNRGINVMTHKELILDCLRVGLDGEKVDYEWNKSEDQSVLVKFEDGKRVRVTVQEMNGV